MKSRKVLIGLLTTLLASSCSLVVKPVRPSTPSSQPTSSSVKPSTSSSASSSTSSSASSASSSTSSSSSKEDSSSISSPSSSSSSNSSATTNEQNVAQINAVKEAINAIGSVTLESLDLIANAESLLNALAPELKAEIGSELLEKLAKARNDYDALVAKAEADAKAIKEVEDAINAIGTVTLESSKAIADAEGLFEALSDELEAKVSAELKTTLENARKTYDELVAKAEAEAKAIKAVEDAIKEIGTVTLESLSKIENAESLLNELDDNLEAKVSSELKEDLVAAREEYNRLVKEKEEAENTAKVNAVKDAINAIGNVTLNSKDEIDAAYDLYNALPDNLKELVDASLLKLLEDAKKDYEDLVAADLPDSVVFEFGDNEPGIVHDKSSNIVHGDGTKVENNKDYTVNGVTITIENPVNFYDGAFDNQGNSAIKLGASSKTASFALIVPEGVNKVILNVAAYKNKTSKIIINNVEYELKTSSNDGEYTPIEIDTSKDNAISIETVSGATRCMINSIELVVRENTVDPDLEVIKPVIDLINSIDEVTLDDLNTIKAAEEAYTALNDTQKAKMEDEYEILVKARETYDALDAKDALDTKLAAAFTDLVEAIGDVTLDDEKAINDAKDALANLTEDQLAKVSKDTLNALKDAETKYNELKAQDEADTKAAKNVEELIENIGEVTLEDEYAIKAAEDAYATLTDDQKAKVNNDVLSKLEEAKTKLEELKQQATEEEQNRSKANAVAKLINAIEEVTLEDKDAIKAAEDAYATLTDDQKALIIAEYETLVKARETYDALEAKDALDTKLAAAFTALVEEIGEVTLDDEKAINDAKDALANLTEDQLAKVSKDTLDALKDAEVKYNELKAQDEADTKVANDFTALVEAIGEVTEDSLEAIEAAEAALKQLTDAQLAKVDEEVLEKLENARKEYDSLTGIDISKVLTAEEAMEYMKSDAYVEFTVLHVTGVISKVKPTSHGYDITLENGFQIYSGKLEEGLNIPQVGYTVTASGKAKIFTYDDGTKVYEIAWDSSHNDSPSIYEIDRNSTPEQDAAMIEDVVDAIELIGEVTLENYKEKLEAIKTAEQLLKDLPVDLKDDVDAKLVEDLEEARKAHDEFAAANAPDSVTFELGEKKEAGHKETTASKETYSESLDGITLTLTNGSKMYLDSNDELGNSCIKFGTGSAAGSFTLIVPQDVINVVFYVAGYKTSSAKISINGEDAQTISTLSNNGEYTPVEVDTSTNKTITFTTVSGGFRCMINSIKFELSKEEVDADQAVVNNVEYNISIIGDLTLENFESKKAAIDAADAAYNALTAEQQAKVNPDSVKALNDAKARYEELVVEKEAADAAAVKAVKDAINALENVTLEDLEAIEEVEYTYKNLSEDLQKQIDEELVNRLKEIREEYEALYETSLPLEEGLLASFEFGANSSVGHVDGNKVNEETGKSYPEGEYTLTLTNVKAVYDGAKDEKGKSVLKLGTSSNAATLTFEVPEDVTSVVILVANYKDKKATITINGENYELENSSNEGKYDVITIDTTTTKSITLATGASNEKRCMINTIKFFGEESQTPVDPNPDQPEPEDPTPDPDPNPNPGNGNLTVESTEGSYYSHLRGKWGPELEEALKTLLVDTHSKNTSYDSLKEHYAITDLGPSGKIMTFYAHAEFLLEWDGNKIDREHVWPKSLGWFETSGAGSDLHHIRPAIKSINNSRGNKPFGDIDESQASKSEFDGYLGGYYNNTYFEPLDHSKGDVARILMYMVHRYSEEVKSHPITDVAQSMDMLVEWHKLDPVDDYEMNRNNKTALIQGNRNPFIDHPEFVDMIYGDYDENNGGALNDTTGGNSLLTDAQRIEKVVNAIDAIGTVTLESESKINAALNAYNSLSSELKAQISDKYAVLQAAKAEYDRLVEENENQNPDPKPEPDPDVPSGTIIFDFGENGAAGTHVDGKDIGTSKSYTEGNYTLELTNATKVFDGEKDAKGNSCIKLGTSSVTGTFTITVPNDVTKVIFLVAKYKAKTSKINVNGKEYTLTTSSDNGEYEEIEVDTSSTKTITFSTVSGGVRCMINSIKLFGNGSSVEPENPGQGGEDVVEPENPGQGGGDVVEPENPGENEDPKDPVISTSSSSLTSENLGLKNSYADSTVTIDGVSLQLTQCADYGDGIQMRYKNSIKSSIANTTAFESGIASLKLVWSTTKSNGFANEKMMMIEFSNSADFSNAEVQYVNTVIGETEYVITPSVSTYKYVRITNNLSYSSYWSAIEVNFASEE